MTCDICGGIGKVGTLDGKAWAWCPVCQDDGPTCPYCGDPMDRDQEYCGSAGCRREREKEMAAGVGV